MGDQFTKVYRTQLLSELLKVSDGFHNMFHMSGSEARFRGNAAPHNLRHVFARLYAMENLLVNEGVIGRSPDDMIEQYQAQISQKIEKRAEATIRDMEAQ